MPLRHAEQADRVELRRQHIFDAVIAADPVAAGAAMALVALLLHGFVSGTHEHEHSRIYYFRNGGADEYFIGSADAMHRNLEHRVEVVAPVEQPQLKQDLQELLELQLSDQRSAWDMQPDGSYVQRMPKKTESEASSQTVQIAMAERRCRDANRLRKRKSKAFGKRNLR